VSAAYLFPGQGAQTAGFLHRLPEHPIVKQTLDEAAEALRLDVLMLDTAGALLSTRNVQLCVLVAGVAVARALSLEGVKVEAAAGLSVGAFGAAVACGVLGFSDALALVRLRGECMEQAYPKGYGMIAIAGLDERQVAAILERVGGADKQVYIANINAPTQVVVSGADLALDAVTKLARERGARRVERLPVSTPSHSPLLHGVSERLAAAMRTVEFHTPQALYVSNRRARVVRDAAGVREDLILNVESVVHWHDSVTVLYELGVRFFVEPPPGQVLTRLVQEAFPMARAMAAEEVPIRIIVQAARRSV
jgi:malonate decarboxylase epsilon subunit